LIQSAYKINENINSENLSEKTAKQDLKEYFRKIINHDKFYEDIQFADFFLGKNNEMEMEKDKK
jgi:hypothetical protein